MVHIGENRCNLWTNSIHFHLRLHSPMECGRLRLLFLRLLRKSSFHQVTLLDAIIQTPQHAPQASLLRESSRKRPHSTL
jgi:hypothetical protein